MFSFFSSKQPTPAPKSTNSSDVRDLLFKRALEEHQRIGTWAYGSRSGPYIKVDAANNNAVMLRDKEVSNWCEYFGRIGVYLLFECGIVYKICGKLAGLEFSDDGARIVSAPYVLSLLRHNLYLSCSKAWSDERQAQQISDFISTSLLTCFPELLKMIEAQNSKLSAFSSLLSSQHTSSLETPKMLVALAFPTFISDFQLDGVRYHSLMGYMLQGFTRWQSVLHQELVTSLKQDGQLVVKLRVPTVLSDPEQMMQGLKFE